MSVPITGPECTEHVYLKSVPVPDAVLQLANMSQHFKFLSANLQFLKRHLKDKPEMLLIGKDVADSSHLVHIPLR